MNIESQDLTNLIVQAYLRGYEDGKESKKELRFSDIIISTGGGMDAQGIAAAVKSQLATMNSHMSAEYTEQR